MGYRTLDAVWRALPALDIRPADCTVLLALAQAARDDTRRCWPGMAWLTAVTKLSRSRIRHAITALTAAGLIDRDAIANGADGRPVYARQGHRTVYLIAESLSPVDNPAAGGRIQAPAGGRNLAPQPASRRQKMAIEAPVIDPPIRTRELHSIVDARASVQTKTSEAAAIVARRLGCPPDVAAAVVAAVDAQHRPRNIAGYVTALDPADLAAVADDLAAAADDAGWRAEYRARKAAAPLCKHKVPDFLNPQTGLPDCPLCRRAASPSEQEESA